MPFLDFTDYDTDPNPRKFMEALLRSMMRLPDDEPPPLGAMILFWRQHKSKPQHCGILVPGGFVHCMSQLKNRGLSGRVVEQRWDRFWTQRVHSYWWPKMEVSD